MSSPQTIIQVLTDEHQARLQELDDGVRRPAGLRDNQEALDRLTLAVATHLVAEEVIIEPAVTRVLTRDGLRDERDMDIRYCIRSLSRAGTRRDAPDDFVGAVQEARAAYLDLTSRTEIEVLPYLYHVFDHAEERRLAEIYPTVCERVAGGYRQEQAAGGRSWEDADLVGRLRRKHVEVLQGVGPPRLRHGVGASSLRATPEAGRRWA